MKNLKNWYLKHERLISSAALIWGFIFNIFTLTRVDQFIENFWVVIHLTIVSLCILAINVIDARGKKDTTLHYILTLVIQGAFGGLVSTFLVFYFRSATLSASWPFLLLLAIMFICNELFKQHYTRLTYQVSSLFISVYVFFIYFLPLVFHTLSVKIFLLSGVVSLIVIGLFILILIKVTKEKFSKSKWMLSSSIVIIFLLINTLYFAHLVPPLPLSLQASGVYHSISRDSTGNYIGSHEPQPWYHYFQSYEPYHLITGQPVYIYSAIFSPAKFNMNIIHQWQYYNYTSKKWITSDTVPLSISGGRDGGYRTYSLKSSVLPGRWRINVLTSTGAYLGRIKFNVLSSTSTSSPLIATSTLE